MAYKEVFMVEKNLSVDLSGKTAIVTGSSRGIGKAISLALAQAGANVVIAARSEEEPPSLPGTIYKTMEEIQAIGGKALPVRCDVTSVDEVQSMVDKAIWDNRHSS
jgi:citronellol/citronellal dehydrogenase